MKALVYYLLAATGLLYSQAGHSGSPIQNFASNLKLWTRAPGAYWEDRDPKPMQETSYTVEPIVRAKLIDIQYEKEIEIRGRFLHEIIESYKPSRESDAVVLHFANGMGIPVPLSLIAKGKIELMVAVAFLAQKDFQQDFPKVSKPSNEWRDPRPIVFTSNKLVLSKPWHPGYGEVRTNGFNPFRHADTLTGIEWIQWKPYEDQYFLDSSVSKGQAVYLHRCQFCHNIRGVGSRFGWDFAGPIKIAEKRNESSLHNHVAYPKMDALERGLMMPAQTDFSETEAHELWTYLALATKKYPKEYK